MFDREGITPPPHTPHAKSCEEVLDEAKSAEERR